MTGSDYIDVFIEFFDITEYFIRFFQGLGLMLGRDSGFIV